MIKQLSLALAICFLLASCTQTKPPQLVPATQPSPTNNQAMPDADELLGDQSAHPAYGVESYRIISQPDEIVSVLKNGMVVITKRIPSPVTTVRAYCLTGGVYEGKWLGGGLSHLLEHLVAGGSNQRRTEEENRNILQDIGNNSNAYTNTDRTSFFVNTTNDNAEKAADLVTGWMLGAKITRAEYSREYMVVQRELEKDKGEADWVFYELTQNNRYLVSPAKVPVIGYQEVIQGLSRDDVYNYYKLAYVPNNMLMVVVGDNDPEKLLAMIQKNVKDAKPGRAFSHNVEQEPPVKAPRNLVATFPKLGQARVDLAFPSVKLSDPDLYALDLLAAVLGSGDSSLTAQIIRDEKQLVTDISVSDFTPTYAEGAFSVDFRTDPDKIAPATKAILELFEKIKKEGVDPQRLKRAKAQLKSGTVYTRQTAENIAESLADGYITTGDPHFADHYLEQILKLEPKDLQAVANKYLDPQKLLTTTLLPEEFVGAAGLPKAQQIVAASATTKPAHADPASPVERIVLDNGTVVLLRRMSSSPTVSVQLYALGGVTAEDAKTNGLGNLAMELLTRGTQTQSAQQIAETLDALGAQVETTTGNNSWTWNATCLKEDLAKLLETYSDIVTHPAFPDAEIAPMKARIQAAIESQDADWFAQANRFFKKAYFGPLNSPYQFTPLGTQENVASFTRDQIKNWYENTILSRPRVLAIYGDIDVAQVRSLVQKQFGGLKKSPAIVPSTPPAAIAQNAGGSTPQIKVARVEVQKTNNPQAGVIIGFNASPVYGEPDTAAIDMADCITSGYGYPTGYIFEILRGRGVVYDANAKSFPGVSNDRPGTFFAYAGCDPKNVNECVDVILESVARLQGSDDDIQTQWYERSKRLIVTGEAIDNETPAAQASQAALDELFGKGYDYHDQFAKRISEVTIDHVRKLAASRLSECVVTISTNEPDKVTTKAGTREYKTFPKVDLTPRGVQHDTGSQGR